MTRAVCITRKVPTDFGNFFIHLDLSPDGTPIGGNISSPMKEPDSQIGNLIHTLSQGLDDALKGVSP